MRFDTMHFVRVILEHSAHHVIHPARTSAEIASPAVHALQPHLLHYRSVLSARAFDMIYLKCVLRLKSARSCFRLVSTFASGLRLKLA